MEWTDDICLRNGINFHFILFFLVNSLPREGRGYINSPFASNHGPGGVERIVTGCRFAYHLPDDYPSSGEGPAGVPGRAGARFDCTVDQTATRTHTHTHGEKQKLFRKGKRDHPEAEDIRFQRAPTGQQNAIRRPPLPVSAPSVFFFSAEISCRSPFPPHLTVIF